MAGGLAQQLGREGFARARRAIEQGPVAGLAGAAQVRVRQNLVLVAEPGADCLELFAHVGADHEVAPGQGRSHALGREVGAVVRAGPLVGGEQGQGFGRHG